MAVEAAPKPGTTENTPAPEVKPAPEATPAWHTSFEDADVKGGASLAKFKGANERELLGHVAKAYVNLEKMPRGVNPPKDDAPQAEWDTFYEKLGRPKTAEEYAVNVKVPEGMPWNKAAETNILKRLHSAGLTKRQAESVINGYIEEAERGNLMMSQTVAKTRQDAEKTMKDEWAGLADLNIALVQRSVSEFGGDEFRAYLDETGLGNDPRFMRFVYAMAHPMMEDGLIRGEGLGMKRGDAKAEIERLMKDPKWLKGDKDIQNRINELYPLAHGGE